MVTASKRTAAAPGRVRSSRADTSVAIRSEKGGFHMGKPRSLAKVMKHVGGVRCATLGHGMRGPVIGHAFYGTDAVIKHLAGIDGWASGRVVLREPLRPPA